MSYRRFGVYNIVGGTVWILLFLMLGWYFGNQKIVQRNFELVIIAIIVISVLPAVYEFSSSTNKAQTRSGRGLIERVQFTF